MPQPFFLNTLQYKALDSPSKYFISVSGLPDAEERIVYEDQNIICNLIHCVACATPAYAQDKTSEIDKIFNWATPATPGCAVAVSLNGKLVVNRAYGSADLERDVPISPSTIFDAGSLTKQFVAAAVLLLVEDGKLSLPTTSASTFRNCPITAIRSRSTICSPTRAASGTGPVSCR